LNFFCTPFVANWFKILPFSCIILQRVCTITNHNLSANAISYQAMSSRHRSLYNVRSLWRRGVGMKQSCPISRGQLLPVKAPRFFPP
jgi:hypothetical protein